MKVREERRKTAAVLFRRLRAPFRFSLSSFQWDQRTAMTQQSNDARRQFRRLACLGLPLGLAILLGACREEEQGRSLHYEKGTYQGAADETIDAETQAQLRHRLRTQRAP